MFAGGSGFDVARNLHMHSKQLILSDADHLAMVWETHVAGRSESVDTIFLTRAKGR